MKRVILASASPRRKEILSKIIDKFDIIVPNIDEKSDKTNVKDYVKDIALKKAMQISKNIENTIIISADTVVYFENKILTKPINEKVAYETLKKLSNNIHKVYTGICIIYNNKIYNYCEETVVYFKKLTDKEIYSYINTHNVYDKAGAYGIQETNFVNKIIGEYDNVVGLATKKLKKILSKIDK